MLDFKQYYTISWKFKLAFNLIVTYRGYKQTFIPLKTHAEMVENNTYILFMQNVKF